MLGLLLLFISYIIFKNTMEKYTGDKMKKHLFVSGILFCLGSLIIDFPLGILITMASLFIAFMLHNITVSKKNVNIILPKIQVVN